MSTPSIVQSNSNYNITMTGSNTVTALSLSATPSVGNAVVVAFWNPTTNGSQLTSLVDNQTGNTFTPIIQKLASNIYLGDAELWWCPSLSTASGTYTITATLAGGASGASSALSIMEVSGAGGVDQSGYGYSQTSTGPVDPTCSAQNNHASTLVICATGGNSNLVGFSPDPPPNLSTTVYDATASSPAFGVWTGTTSTLVTASAGNSSWSNSAGAVGVIATFYPAGGPLAVRQACTGSSGSTSVLSQSGYFAEATLPGSCIFVVATSNSGGGALSFSDAINGAYTGLDYILDSSALTQGKSFVFQNAASIGTGNALTVSHPSSGKYTAFVAFEIQNTTANCLAAHAAALQTLAVTTANAISSGNVQAGTGSALVLGVSANLTENNTAPFYPIVGTGFTPCPSPGTTFWPFNSNNSGSAEYATVTNPGQTVVTFTPPGASSDDYMTFIAVFNQIGGAFVPTFTLTQFFVNDTYVQM